MLISHPRSFRAGTAPHHDNQSSPFKPSAQQYDADRLEELRRSAQGAVWRAVAYTHRAYVSFGQLRVSGGRAAEMQEWLKRFNCVPSGYNCSLAAHVFARDFLRGDTYDT